MTRKYKTKTLAVYADVSKDLIRNRLSAGHITGCGAPVPLLNREDIAGAPDIVGQMGAEPFLDAMFANPDYDVVVGGRSYDPAPFVAFMAYTAMQGRQQPLHTLSSTQLGGFFHIGKILECGGQCATPKSSPARATIYTNGTFDVIGLQPGTRCTSLSVATHTFYEKSRPDLLHGPGGCLDLTKSTYTELSDGRSCRSTGAVFRHNLTQQTDPSGTPSPYTIKLEAARTHGFRTLFIGTFRDPLLTSQLDDYLPRIHKYVRQQHAHLPLPSWDLVFHPFGALGQNGTPFGEVCIVGECFGLTQEIANSVSNAARVACIHGPYKNQKATSGNMAFGIGGLTEIAAGAFPQFCLYHLMNLIPCEEGAVEVNKSPLLNGNFVPPTHAEGGDITTTTLAAAPLFSYRVLSIGEQTNPLPHHPRIPSANTSAPTTTMLTPATQSTHTNPLPTLPPTGNPTLGHLASIIRSKNAGPYEITFDLLFHDPALFHALATASPPVLSKPILADLYGLASEADVIFEGWFGQALGWKGTIPRVVLNKVYGREMGVDGEGVGKGRGRYTVSGGWGDEDVHGSQMYERLASVEVPRGLVEGLLKRGDDSMVLQKEKGVGEVQSEKQEEQSQARL